MTSVVSPFDSGRHAGIEQAELERLDVSVAPVDLVGDQLRHDAGVVELLAAHQVEHGVGAREVVERECLRLAADRHRDGDVERAAGGVLVNRVDRAVAPLDDVVERLDGLAAIAGCALNVLSGLS